MSKFNNSKRKTVVRGDNTENIMESQKMNYPSSIAFQEVSLQEENGINLQWSSPPKNLRITNRVG